MISELRKFQTYEHPCFPEGSVNSEGLLYCQSLDRNGHVLMCVNIAQVFMNIDIVLSYNMQTRERSERERERTTREEELDG